MKTIAAALFSVAFITACSTSSNILVGTQRPPIEPEKVKIYAAPPAKFEQVAIIQANSKSSFSFGEQGRVNTVVDRLKKEAASLGANGVLLQGVGDITTGSVGTSFGNATATTMGNTTNAFGSSVGVGAAIRAKSGQGMAIYVTEE